VEAAYSPQDFLLADFESDWGCVLKLKQCLNASGQDTTDILLSFYLTSNFLSIFRNCNGVTSQCVVLVALIIPLGRTRGSEEVTRIESVVS